MTTRTTISNLPEVGTYSFDPNLDFIAIDDHGSDSTITSKARLGGVRGYVLNGLLQGQNVTISAPDPVTGARTISVSGSLDATVTPGSFPTFNDTFSQLDGILMVDVSANSGSGALNTINVADLGAQIRNPRVEKTDLGTFVAKETLAAVGQIDFNVDGNGGIGFRPKDTHNERQLLAIFREGQVFEFEQGDNSFFIELLGNSTKSGQNVVISNDNHSKLTTFNMANDTNTKVICKGIARKIVAGNNVTVTRENGEYNIAATGGGGGGSSNFVAANVKAGTYTTVNVANGNATIDTNFVPFSVSNVSSNTGIIVTKDAGSLDIGIDLAAGDGIDVSGRTISTEESKRTYDTRNAYNDDSSAIPAWTFVVADEDFIITDGASVDYAAYKADVASSTELGAPGGVTRIAIPGASGGNSGRAKDAVITEGIFDIVTSVNLGSITRGSKLYLREVTNNNRKSWTLVTTYQAGDLLVGRFLNSTGTDNEYTVEMDFDLARHAGNSDEIPEGSSNKFLKDNTVGADELKVTGDGSSGQALLSDGDGTMSWGQAGVADGGVTTAKLADDAVTSAKIAVGAVNKSELADAAVSTVKIADGAVDTAKLAANAVSGAKITANTITTRELAVPGQGTNGQVLTSDGDGTMSWTAKGGAGEGSIPQDGSVSTAKIINGAVTGEKLAANAVTEAKVANDAVGDRQIADDAVNTYHINDNVKATVDQTLLGQENDKFVTPLGVEKAEEALLGPEQSFDNITVQTSESSLAANQIFIETDQVKIHSASDSLKAKLLRGADFAFTVSAEKYMRGIVSTGYVENGSVITVALSNTTKAGTFANGDSGEIGVQGEFRAQVFRSLNDKLNSNFSSLEDLPGNFQLVRTNDSIAVYDQSTSTIYQWKIRDLEAQLNPVALKEETLSFTYKTTVPGGGLNTGEIHNRIIGVQESFFVTPQTVDLKTLTAIFTADYLVELKESDSIFVKGVSTGSPSAQGNSIVIQLQADSVTKQGTFTNDASVTLTTEGRHPDRSEIDYGTTLSNDRYKLASTRTITTAIAGVNSNINTVQANLTSNVNTVQSNVTSLSSEVDDIYTELDTVSANTDTNKTNINTVQSNLASYASTANTNTNTVEANLASFASTANTNISTVQSNLASNAAAIVTTLAGKRNTSDSIGTSDLADDAVTQAKMAPSSVGTTEILDDAVTAAKLAEDSVQLTMIDTASAGSADQFLKRTSDGLDWATVTSGGGGSSNFTAANVKAGAGLYVNTANGNATIGANFANNDTSLSYTTGAVSNVTSTITNEGSGTFYGQTTRFIIGVSGNNANAYKQIFRQGNIVTITRNNGPSLTILMLRTPYLATGAQHSVFLNSDFIIVSGGILTNTILPSGGSSYTLVGGNPGYTVRTHNIYGQVYRDFVHTISNTTPNISGTSGDRVILTNEGTESSFLPKLSLVANSSSYAANVEYTLGNTNTTWTAVESINRTHDREEVFPTITIPPSDVVKFRYNVSKTRDANVEIKNTHLSVEKIAAVAVSSGGSGGTPADGSITTAKLADDAVTQAKIASGAVGSVEIADDAVTQAKVGSAAIGTTELAADAVTQAKIASGAVGTTELADDAVTQAKVADDAIGGAQLKTSNAAADGKLLASDGTDFTYVDAPAGGTPADGSITTAKLADDAVTKAKLNADTFASITDLRTGTATDVGINPSVISNWHDDLHRRDKFTGYNKTSNATVGIGEYKIDGATITVRPKADDVTNFNNRTFLNQIFTAENADRTSIYAVRITAKTFSENIITLTIVTTPAEQDLNSSGLGDASNIFIEGPDAFNTRRAAYDFGPSGGGGSVDFATEAEVLAGTVTNKAVAPNTLKELVEHETHVAVYNGFTNQSSINADGSNLAAGSFYINDAGTEAYFRGHNDTEGAAIKEQFLVDRSAVMIKTGGRLDFDFTAVSVVDVSGSDNDVIKITITNHRSTPAVGVTLTGDWSIRLLPEQNKAVFQNAPAGTVPLAALASIPAGQAKGLSAAGNSGIGLNRFGDVSDTEWNNITASDSNLLPIPHPNQSTTPSGTGEVTFSPKSAASTFICLANVGFGWLGDHGVKVHFLVARKIGNGAWTVIPGSKKFNVLNGNYGGVDLNVTPFYLDAPNTTEDVSYRWMIVRGNVSGGGNNGRVYPIAQSVIFAEVTNL